MKLNELSLTGWRSYEAALAGFDPGINLILGQNAQGKTNLLEAIYYLSTGKSFRTRVQGELIRHGSDYAELQADLTSQDRDQTLRVVLFSNRRRRILEKNGVRQKSWTEAGGLVHTVLFCPEDLQVLRAGASGRRRLLDDALCQLRPAYDRALTEYSRLQEQKARILKDWRDTPNLLDLLPDYNTRMAQVGAILISYRARYVKALGQCAADYHGELSGGREALRLDYQTVSAIMDPFAPQAELSDLLSRQFELRRSAELETGICLTGPHKDDFGAYLGDLPVKSYASQGQTRTAAISLKLAERELSRRDTGQEPILLLDDVLSELDAARQDYVLNRLGGGQVFITCCEEKRLSGLGRQFIIQDGTIQCL